MTRLTLRPRPGTVPASGHTRTTVVAAALLSALAVVPTALAQQTTGGKAVDSAAAAADEAPAPAPLQVGDATQSLLALQRSGDRASTTPRPIPGEIAHRSYERYLNSFNHPIPEKYTSTVTVKGVGK